MARNTDETADDSTTDESVKPDRSAQAKAAANRVRTRLAQVVWIVCVAAAVILAAGALCVALKANPDNALVKFILDTADKLDLGVFSAARTAWPTSRATPTPPRPRTPRELGAGGRRLAGRRPGPRARHPPLTGDRRPVPEIRSQFTATGTFVAGNCRHACDEVHARGRGPAAINPGRVPPHVSSYITSSSAPPVPPRSPSASSPARVAAGRRRPRVNYTCATPRPTPTADVTWPSAVPPRWSPVRPSSCAPRRRSLWTAHQRPGRGGSVGTRIRAAPS